MIKKYNQFVNTKVNENMELEGTLEVTQNELQDLPDTYVADVADVEEEEEEEAGDIFGKRLQELADLLEIEMTDSKLVFNGQEVIFPSETEMYHVGKKKFKTAVETAKYLTEQEITTESKSYKNRYK